MKLSFVIPSYNSSAWLAQSVGSCLEQTYRDVEVVIVDDCSTDSTGQYLEWLMKNHKNVLVHRNEVNMGRSWSRNKGNSIAQGEILAVLDADDLSLPSRAKITVEQFKNGVKYLYGSAVRIDACGRTAGEIRADVFDRAKALELLSNHIVHSTSAYSRDVAARFPYRDGETARLGVDDFCLQHDCLVGGIKLDFVPNVLSCYRILEQGITAQRDNNEVVKFKKEFVEGLTANV